MRAADKKMAEALGKEKASTYPSLNNNVYLERVFGEKSALFNTIMMDGYVFNPYIHRRWIPVQYRELTEKYSHCSLDKGISREYDYKYMLRFVIQEINKLCILERYDKKAFIERSKFFTLDCVKSILSFHINYIKEFIPVKPVISCYIYTVIGYLPSEYYEVVKTLYKYGRGIEMRRCFDYSKGIDRLNNILFQIKTAQSYFELKKIVRSHYEFYVKIINLYNKGLAPEFIEAFWKSGAYYSIKNEIMFQNGSIYGLKGNAAIKKIREMLDEGIAANEFHKLYISMN